jgi:hypothetical protein
MNNKINGKLNNKITGNLTSKNNAGAAAGAVAGSISGASTGANAKTNSGASTGANAKNNSGAGANSNSSTNNSSNNKTIRKSTYSSDTFILVLGFLLLIGMIIYIYNYYKSLKGPTSTVAYTACPDYWDSLGNGKCQNVNKIGSCSTEDGADIMDFGGEVFTNTNTGNYAKCRWTNSCNVSWGNIDRLC